MTYISLKGIRESKTVKSEEYKKKVIEFMESRGHVKIHDSGRESVLPDIILKIPLVEGDKETWVEIKYSELSLSDKQFLNELGRFFNGYMLRDELKRFNFYIFAKKFVNQQKWRNIFEETKCYDKDVKNLMEKISQNLQGDDLIQFQKYTFDDFVFFITDCSIVEGDYEDLFREIAINKEKHDYVLNQDLLKDDSNIIHKKESLMCNFVKITSLPSVIWVADCKGKIDIKDFFRNNRDAIVYFHKNKIYSVKPIKQSSNMEKYILPKSIKKINIDTWDVEEKTKINAIKYLIRSYIISKGKILDQRYWDEQKCLFFINKNPERYPDYKHYKYIVSKYYKGKETGFVKHDALRFNVYEINKEFYVVFNMRFIFTEDGYNVITGKSSTALHRKFRKNFSNNQKERNQLSRWISWLNLNSRTIFNADTQYFNFSRPLTIVSPITYEGGEVFESDLFDYFKSDEEEMIGDEECLSA